MQAIPVQIIPAQAITDTAVSYYVSPANKTTIISKLTFTNHGGDAESIDVHIVVTGGSATAGNKVISAKVINANEAWPAYPLEGHVLPAGSSIYCKTLTAASTDIVVAGAGVQIF